VIGTSPAGDADYREVNYALKPVLLIMGSERTGITPEHAALCDHLVRIPMAGYVESLNLSIAAALVLYEVMRQRS
jgi:tRNA G18 (ribose-2'-O)-methylase SpoU